jgi:uncharacterized protein YabN with tetrapyrrole methylase and pyrophosphatase domain
MKRANIYLLGRGIVDGVGQMTLEALTAMRSCRLVFDLSGDAEAIKKIHPRVVDLHDEYWTGELCSDVYERLERRILDEAAWNRRGSIAVVVDGHPMFFDDVNWGMLRNGRKRGLTVVALPGISCLDTMMIDVDTDLGDGAQIVHANHLLLYDIALDAHLQTYVLQIGKFGSSFFSRETKRNRPGRFTPLIEHLGRFYNPDTMVTLIVSLGAESLRQRVRLDKLDKSRAFLHRHEDDGLTMHIPAQPRGIVNERFSRELDDIEHLARIAELA